MDRKTDRQIDKQNNRRKKTKGEEMDEQDEFKQERN